APAASRSSCRSPSLSPRRSRTGRARSHRCPRRSAASRSCATASGTTCPRARSCTSAASKRRRSRPRRWPGKGNDMADGGKTLQLVVVTPERAVLDERVDFVALPLYDGELGVLPDRAPLIGRLGYGELRLRRGALTQRYFVDGGFAQVRDNVVTVLTARAIRAEDINVPAAEQALEAARAPATTPEAQEAQYKAQLRARAQIQVARRGHGTPAAAH